MSTETERAIRLTVGIAAALIASYAVGSVHGRMDGAYLCVNYPQDPECQRQLVKPEGER